MSNGEGRRVSHHDIQLVQNLIERCLQLYMNQKEVVDTLLIQAKIEPGFTELVWQKLEEENREFFKAYHVRLVLKNQIMIFNKLLEKQVELMRRLCQPDISSLQLSNGSNSAAVHQTPPSYSSEPTSASRPDNMLCNGDTSHALMNGSSSAPHGIQVRSSIPVRGMDMSANMIAAQTSNIGMLQGTNGTSVKTEPCYSDNSEFPFYPGASFMETRTTIEDAANASFSSSDLAGPQLNGPLQDLDTPSYGFLDQLPRNFSFSDLTDHFTQCADIFNYGRSPFVPPEANNFDESPRRGGNRQLDTISEGVSYEDFGSD